MSAEGNGKLFGNVFDIQRFSTHDGPGIRTTVFLKGCPLSCSWCHNPESQLPVHEIFFNRKSCINCETCNQVCPSGDPRQILSKIGPRKEICGTCILCVAVCPSKAIDQIGQIYTSDEIVEEAIKDLPFFDHSNGGMTLSGGEPLFQFDFTLDILKKIKQKEIHTVVETSGYTTKERILGVAPFVDLFLWDIKITDKELHKKYTGVSLNPIIENLKLIDKAGAKTILRILVIPGVNMNDLHFRNIASLYHDLINVQGIEFLKYHDYGISKDAKLGQPDHVPFPIPTELEMDRIHHFFDKMDTKIKIIR